MNGSAVLAVALVLSTLQNAGQPQKYLHAVEWTDPAGDVEPIGTSTGTRPGFDIVKLRLAGFTSGNAIRVLKRYAEGADELASLEDEDR